MKRRNAAIVVLAIAFCVCVVASMQVSEARSGGMANANYTISQCGCHSSASTATLTAVPSTTTPSPGQQMTIAVTVSGGQQAAGQMLGVMLLTSTNAAPSADGWTIVTDPAGTTFNWNQVAWASPHTFTWNVRAPSTVGVHTMNIYTVHGGGADYVKQIQMSVTVTAASTPPTVTITSPITGNMIGGVATFTANVIPGSSAVTSATLTLSVGAISVIAPSPISTTPYTWQIDTRQLPNGVATAVANVTSLAGTGSSTVSGLTVDNSLPVITINNPLSGSTVGGVIWVNATIAPGNSVSMITSANITVDGTTIVDPWSAPYAYQLNTRAFTDGAHQIIINAMDNHGNMQTAIAVINVDNLAPQITITSPLNGEYVAGTSTINATATDASPIKWVSFRIDTMEIANLTSLPYQATWNTASFGQGAHTITVSVSDIVNNIHSTTTTVQVDNTGPIVDITAPLNGVVVTGTILVGANVAALHTFTVSNVQLLVDGVLQNTLTAPPYNFSYNTVPLSDGQHAITVRGTDANGNIGSQSITIIANNGGTAIPPPQVVITTPLNGATVGGTINVVANVVATSPATLISATLYIDNAPVSTLTVAPFSWAVDTASYTDGPHTFNVTALDSNARAGFMAINVGVNNAAPLPPSVSITSPLNGETVTGAFYINATVNSPLNIGEVQFRIDGVLVASMLNTPYSYLVDSSLLTDGRHTINATAIDSRLQSGYAEIPIIVNNALPLVQIAAPLNGTAVFGTVVVNATAISPYIITLVQLFVDDVLAMTLTVGPYEFSLDTSAYTDGLHVVRVTANDAGGRSSSASISLTIANGPPSVQIITPMEGANVSRTMPVSADIVASAGVRYVIVLIDETVFINTTVQNYYWPINTGLLANGQHLVTVRAIDLLGRMSEDTRHITVSNPTPSVTIGGVVPGSNVSGVITITGTATPLSEIAYVTITFNGILLENRTAPPFYFSIDTRGYANGPAEINVTAYTFAGISNSSAVSFNVFNQEPLPDMSNWAATMLASAFGSVAVMAVLVVGALAYRRKKRLGRLRKW